MCPTIGKLLVDILRTLFQKVYLRLLAELRVCSIRVLLDIIHDSIIAKNFSFYIREFYYLFIEDLFSIVKRESSVLNISPRNKRV